MPEKSAWYLPVQKHDGLSSDELLCCEPAEEMLGRAKQSASSTQFMHP